MIDFVLECFRQEACGLHIEDFTRPVLGPHLDLSCALHLLGKIRDAETPLFLDGGPFRGDDFRIDQHEKGMAVSGVLPRAQVDHRQLERNPHLVRGKPDAGRCMHGLYQVLDQAVQGFVDFFHTSRFVPEHRVRVGSYLSNCHTGLFNMIPVQNQGEYQGPVREPRCRGRCGDDDVDTPASFMVF
jgi:hypothetical protein